MVSVHFGFSSNYPDTLKKWTCVGNEIRNLSDLDDICAMTHLAIDQGNSFTKISVFRNGNMVFHSAISDHDLNTALENAIEQWNPDSCILSSVRKELDDVLKSIEPRCKVLVLDHNTPLPFTSNYETPATLGMDRIANTAGAIQRLSDASILVVDCGTCITYSVIQNRTFLGGTISPGLNMRYKALHHFTGKLPQLEPVEDIPSLLGTSTANSIHSGVGRAIIAETDAMIGQYCSQFNDLNVLLTGGSMAFFEKHLKSPIFAVPYLTPEGLHEILLFNEK